MKASFITSSVAALLLSSSLAFGATYKVDTAHSSVGFKIKHMMISNVNGNFGTFDGSFDINDGKLTTINGIVKVSSIDTDNEKRDGHLKSADFFDVANHPEITFKATKIDDDKVIGDLTIKNVTKQVTLALDFGGTAKDPWGNERAGLALTGKINREAFGLTYNQALETGGVLIGKELKLIAEIEGIAAK